MRTEIVPLLIVTKLEQYDYAGATAIALVMLRGLVRHAAAGERPAGLGRAPRSAAVAERRAGDDRADAGGAPPRGDEDRDRGAVGAAHSDRARPRLPVAVGAAAARLGVRQAFGRGAAVYLQKLADPDARSAIALTLLTAAIAVPLNTVFGVAAAWLIAKFRLPRQEPAAHAHRPALLGLAGDLRPGVRAAVRGAQGASGPGCAAHDVNIIFAMPGIVLATTFVTFPFVAREVLPVMQAPATTRRRPP